MEPTESIEIANKISSFKGTLKKRLTEYMPFRRIWYEYPDEGGVRIVTEFFSTEHKQRFWLFTPFGHEDILEVADDEFVCWLVDRVVTEAEFTMKEGPSIATS